MNHMDVDGFVRDGYAVVRGAFDAATAAVALATRGEAGMPGGDLPALLRPSTLCRTTAEATGAACFAASGTAS